MNAKTPGFLSGLTRWWGSRRVTATADFESMASVLLSGKGEASGVALASHLLAAYRALPRADQRRFFALLATRFGPDLEVVQRAVAEFVQRPDSAAAARLHALAEPRRQELIRRMNLAPGGTSQLVAMREDLLQALQDDRSLAAVDADFRHLFASWFNRGFLTLQRIDWSTPAHILEKIIHYEAVHAITSWDDLRLRLEPADRRCFAFFHPALVGEPLIFVEVALTTEVPTAIAPLLGSGRVPVAPERATTAVFYSISNTQRGLRGISFGNFLIKQVAEDLKRELPSLSTFVTLSPLPGFRRWLAAPRSDHGAALDAATAALLEPLRRADWHVAPAKGLRDALSRAVLRYLLDAKDGTGKPVDSVARFHLGNGARLERLHWMADASEKGLAQGAGFMVNYLYDLGAVERNHEAFANDGEIVVSPEIQRLERTLLRT
jgi:malonyl-CoA decarboxylase|nr:malonyl-CoA decarboxylase [Caldimonas sp.]